tara:strand:- start:414 stop:944 length:531 start_codon:yes stop_codon:yes gene_type:complete
MTKYIIKKGSRTSTPSIAKFCVKGATLSARFTLGLSFIQLYELTDNSTHKIIGLSDLFGKNSIRMGFRRSPSNKVIDEFVPVAYLHQEGKTLYPKIEGMMLKIGKTYEVTFYKNVLGYYDMKLDELDQYNYVVKTVHALSLVQLSTGCKRLQGIYIEVGSKPSPWDLDMEVDYNLI